MFSQTNNHHSDLAAPLGAQMIGAPYHVEANLPDQELQLKFRSADLRARSRKVKLVAEVIEVKKAETCLGATYRLYVHDRFGSLADIPECNRYVRCYIKSGHVQCNSVCPLCANSGQIIANGAGHAQTQRSTNCACIKSVS